MNRNRRQRLRILYVGTLPPHHGGSAIMAAQLLGGLASSGYDIEAISPITEQTQSRGDPFAQRSALSVSRFTMPYLDTSPDTPPDPGYIQLEGAQIKRLFERSVGKHRPDVVIIGRESFAPHAVDLARDADIPSVVLFQGATTMGILNGTYPQTQARHLLEHARRADLAVTCAEHMREVVMRFGLPEVKMIPNPVDVDRFRRLVPPVAMRRSLRVRDEDVVVMHVSNLKQLKRPQDFVRAAAHLATEERELLFVVVGDGPCRQELEELCVSYGITDRVRFTGWVEYDRIPQVLNCSDIVAVPSAGEAQALVYLEAQACERTLIASEIPAAHEVIDHGHTGLLHRIADARDLSAKLLMAVRDEELRARIGRQARNAVRGHALHNVVSRYGDLLDALARGYVRP